MAQMLLHCWACRLVSSHPHILRVVAEFFTANSPRPRATAFTSKWHLTLTQLAWRKDCSFSAALLEVCFSTPLRLPRAYSRASARPAVRWACRLSWPDFLPMTPYCIDFSVQHSSRISFSAHSSLQHSQSPCDHFQCHLIDSLVRLRRKNSFFFGRSQSQRTHFSGFPQLVDGSYLKHLCALLPAQGNHAPPSLTSARFNDITIALSTTLPALSRVNIHALPLFSSFCHTFPLRNDRSRAQRISVAWHFSSFTQLHTETALHPAPPLFFFVDATLTPGCFCDFNCCIHFSLRLSYCFCRFLCQLFCACSCTVFFCVSVLAKLSTPIFPWGGILI